MNSNIEKAEERAPMHRKIAHAAYDIRYKLVWSTKHQQPILVGDKAIKMRAIIKQVCSELNVEIIEGVVQKNCIQIIISAPPTISISTLVGKIKGKSAITMLKENDHIRDLLLGDSFWARGYFVTTDVSVQESIILKYIEVEE